MAASLLSITATLIVYRSEKDLTREYAITKYFIRMYSSGVVSDEAKRSMVHSKKKRKRLVRKLAAIFGGAQKQIELGSVMIQHDGLAVHVQHLIFSKELDKYRRHKNQYNISVEIYMNHLFRRKMNKIFDAMWTHFTLDTTNADKKEYAVSFAHELDDGSGQGLQGTPISVVSSSDGGVTGSARNSAFFVVQ